MKYAAFPWMIVELKRESGNEEQAVRQAANGCHATLVLHEKLASLSAQDVLPTIAFTFVGPEASLFVACDSKAKNDTTIYVSSERKRY